MTEKKGAVIMVRPQCTIVDEDLKDVIRATTDFQLPHHSRVAANISSPAQHHVSLHSHHRVSLQMLQTDYHGVRKECMILPKIRTIT